LGTKVIRPGNNTHSIITEITAIKNGQLSFANSSIEQPIIKQTEYIATPTGEVKNQIYPCGFHNRC